MITGALNATAWVAAYQETHDWPAWLRDRRQASLLRFAERGFPTLRDEEWRYTNLSVLNKQVFAPATQHSIDSATLNALRIADTLSVVLVNGRFSTELSQLGNLPSNLTVLSLRDAASQPSEKLQAYWGKAVNEDQHGLLPFNSAWSTDGVWLEVAAGSVIEQPIQIIHVVTEASSIAATRNLIVVNANAELNLIETYAGSAERYFSATVNEYFVGQNAGLTVYKLQNEAAGAVHFGGHYVQQDSDSRFTHHHFALGAALARSDVQSDLQTAAQSVLNGLYVGRDRQHLDTHTRINHLQAHGVSREFYKGVMDGKSRAVFQGRVVVAQEAQHTDSQMNNRNLLLSSDAEVDSKPQLEIYADDVKCSHGMTVGQLEEQSLFYLQSRGLDLDAARHVLTFAFANEMVDKVDNAAVKAWLVERLLQRFDGVEL